MKTLVDAADALTHGLAAIRTEFQVPGGFPSEVLRAANIAAARIPSVHADRTDLPFVTLDPASSTDLDQAFCIEASGADLLLRYAIADVAWFVDDGDPIDAEAWRRGETLYLPDGKAGVYPPVLSEGAASLLPSGPRPAVIFLVRVRPGGAVRLEAVERAIIRSRAKLAYDSVQPGDLPTHFAELARRIHAAEAVRGGARVDPPEQEITRGADGSLKLAFRSRLASEADNSALSLATNMAVAECLQAHGTGLFRIMAAPDARAVARLRLAARAIGLEWSEDQPLEAFERTLGPADAREAAFMLAVRRAGEGASYAPFQAGVVPWHAAVAATYAHATAPLRRLADRYVVQAALAVANGQVVPDAVTRAFETLPGVMARADARAGRIERAAIDLAESVLLAGLDGSLFAASVIEADARGARVQLRDLPIVARIAVPDLQPGARIDLTLVAADPDRRTTNFTIA